MSSRDPKTFKRLPPPEKREKLALTALFSDAEGDRMRQGFAPRDMDDRWFVYFDKGWLNFYGSWTGAHIYALKLDGTPFGVRVVEGWVSRDKDYNSPGIEYDREFVAKLARSLFGDEARVR
jgi:hypothetical protein